MYTVDLYLNNNMNRLGQLSLPDEWYFVTAWDARKGNVTEVFNGLGISLKERAVSGLSLKIVKLLNEGYYFLLRGTINEIRF